MLQIWNKKREQQEAAGNAPKAAPKKPAEKIDVNTNEESDKKGGVNHRTPSTNATPETSGELEAFRQDWREQITAKAEPPLRPQQRPAKWKIIRDRDIASPAAIQVWTTTELAVKILNHLPSATILKLSVLDRRTKNIIHRTSEVLHDFIFKDAKRPPPGGWQRDSAAYAASVPKMMSILDPESFNSDWCWEHGCNGRKFLSSSMYRKHCKEYSALNPLLPGQYSEKGHIPCGLNPSEGIEEAWYVEVKKLSGLGWDGLPGWEAKLQRLRTINDESPRRILPAWYVPWKDLNAIARTENGWCWQEAWIAKDKGLVEVRAGFARERHGSYHLERKEMVDSDFVHARTMAEVVRYMQLPHDAILDSAVLKWRLETLGAPVKAIEVLGLKDVVPRDRLTPSEDGEAPTARRIMPAGHVEE